MSCVSQCPLLLIVLKDGLAIGSKIYSSMVLIKSTHTLYYCCILYCSWTMRRMLRLTRVR